MAASAKKGGAHEKSDGLLISAVIFDMDGVLIDSEPLQLKSFNKVLERYGKHVTMNDFKGSYMGKRDTQICGNMIADYNLPISERDFVKEKRKGYANILNVSIVKPTEGTASCLTLLKKNGLKLAIASSSSLEEIKAVAGKFGIADYFSTLVSAHDVTNGKPSPDVYLKAAEKLNIKPEMCAAIEDTPTGIKSAKSAGMVCIAITTTHKEVELKEADKIVRRLNEIPNIVGGRK